MIEPTSGASALGSSVTLPLWLVVLMAIFAVWAVVSRVVLPVVRGVIRWRVSRALEEVNPRLSIRIHPYKLTRRQVLVDRLTYDPRVLEVADEHARKHKIPQRLVIEKVRRYAREIVPAFNAYFYFRIGYYIARWVARSLYRVRLGAVDEAALAAAIPPRSTVVFVINHRSNMDYILVSYLAMERTALSYAVGEWARIWPLQQLIRATGAYFVRRNSKNPLYRRVLERYVQMATEGGITQAMFPEGRLSRDGSLQPPRLGIFDYMLREFDPTGSRDIAFIPVAINFDRVLEDRTLLLDVPSPAEGEEKRPAAALPTALRFLGRHLLLLLRLRWHRFGYACVNVGRPVSLRGYLKKAGVDLRDLSRDERFVEVGKLAADLMEEIGRAVPVIPVPLVSRVFQDAGDEPLSELEIKARFHDLIERFEAVGAYVYVPRGSRDYAATVGLRTLVERRVVEEGPEGLFRARSDEAELLAYYANSIRHLLPEDA